MNTLWKIFLAGIIGVVIYTAATFWIQQIDNEVRAASFDEDIVDLSDEWFPDESPWHNEAYCLAEAIYFEAGNQPLIGKIAVGQVIINRMYEPKYPNTICGVVHQGPVRESWKKNGVFHPIKYKCQFSYWCDGKSDTPKYGPTWEDSMIVAEWLSTDLYNTSEFTIPHDYLEGATHYHATYVYPSWASHLQEVVKIQDHIFYK